MRKGAMLRDSAIRDGDQGKREGLLLKSRTTTERWSETECEGIGHLGVRFVPALADPNLCWALSRASWNAFETYSCQTKCALANRSTSVVSHLPFSTRQLRSAIRRTFWLPPVILASPTATRGCDQGMREDSLLKSRTTPGRWSETECEGIGHLDVPFVPASADPNLCCTRYRASWSALRFAHHKQVLLYRGHIALPAPSGCHVRASATVRQVGGTIAYRWGAEELLVLEIAFYGVMGYARTRSARDGLPQQQWSLSSVGYYVDKT